MKTDLKNSLIEYGNLFNAGGVNGKMGMLVAIAVKQLTADNSWVKCSDRLPEEGQSVLVAIPVGNSFNVENATYRNDGVFLCCWCTKRGKNCAYDVTYWRPSPPLPTAPLDH